MKAVVQRVMRARVAIDQEIVGEIGPGLVVLAAVETGDTADDLEWMAGKLLAMRIFRSSDGAKHFDRDVRDAGGGILLVSNFTVAAETAKGRRPSLSNAAPPDEARLMFEQFVAAVRAAAGSATPVETGRFAAAMRVEIDNDGPVTFILESRQRSAD